jgi:hypothetical protein
MVHRSSICILQGQSEIVWAEDVLLTSKEACRLEAFSRYPACGSLLVKSAELFANLVNSADLAALVWTELYFKFLGEECFQGPHEGFIQGLHFVTVVRWEANDVNNNDL